MKLGRENSAGMAWRRMLVLAGAAILLQGCTDHFVKLAHLGDNPMDQAIFTGMEGDHMKETRDRLLKRFPPGQPVAPAKRYLKSVGAKCLEPSATSASVTCRYSQHMDVVLRTPVGDFPEIRSIYTFRIELTARQGRLRDVRVCEQITRVWFNTGSDGKRRTDYPMECLEGQKSKGG